MIPTCIVKVEISYSQIVFITIHSNSIVVNNHVQIVFFPIDGEFKSRVPSHGTIDSHRTFHLGLRIFGPGDDSRLAHHVKIGPGAFFTINIFGRALEKSGHLGLNFANSQISTVGDGIALGVVENFFAFKKPANFRLGVAFDRTSKNGFLANGNRSISRPIDENGRLGQNIKIDYL